VPELLKAYAKALAPRGTGDALPERREERRGVEVDAEHLAAYARVCGFRLADALPPTYPRVLGFPAAMTLMTDRAFPFPLLGVVHVADRIEQRRPLRLGEPVDLAVWAEDLRPHPKGRQLDVVTEASVEGEPVWRERSTYLRRGAGGSGERREPEDVGDLPVAARWRVAEDAGRRYAAVSGDRNPIHLHPLTARPFGFKQPIAHGMWTLARCLAALEGRLPGALRVDAAFGAPVRLGGCVELATGRAADGASWRFAVRSGERVHLSGVAGLAGAEGG
jgi:acyl dehydratase